MIAVILEVLPRAARVPREYCLQEREQVLQD